MTGYVPGVAFRAVLDACVLYPFSLRDVLLRLAERELYDVYWSDRILAEMTRNLIANDLTDQAGAERLVRLMSRTFDAAAVSVEAVDRRAGHDQPPQGPTRAGGRGCRSR